MKLQILKIKDIHPYERNARKNDQIAIYDTGKYFNKVKSGWGINRFLPNVENWWKPATIDVFEDNDALQMSILFRKFIRNGEIERAKKVFELFEFGGWEV